MCCDRAHYYRFNAFFTDAIVCKIIGGGGRSEQNKI